MCVCVSCYIPCACSGSGSRHATTTIKSRVSFCCGRSAFLVAPRHVVCCCVSFLSLTLIHIARLQQLLESVKHTRCYSCLSIDIAILTHSHTQLHSLALVVIILARILLLATRRRRNAAAAQPHGSVSKQQLTGQRHKQSTFGGTLWEWNSDEQRNERSQDFA